MIYVSIMELRQLRYFAAVAEELHFGRAARRMNISQPPLSMQIRNLEEELGLSLFRRTSRSVTLTPEGRLFYDDVSKILKQLGTAVDTVQKAAKGQAGSLSMAFVSPAMDTFLPAAVHSFRRHRPGIVLSFEELATNDQLKALRESRIQVGFLRLFHHDLKDLRTQVIWTESYVVALPKGHPLGGKSRINLCDLEGTPMIMYPRASQPALYDRIMGICQKAGFAPDVSQEAMTKHTTTALVAAGMGAAIVPASSENFRKDGIVYRPINDALPRVEISMVWRADEESAALSCFLNHMATAFHCPGGSCPTGPGRFGPYRPGHPD